MLITYYVSPVMLENVNEAVLELTGDLGHVHGRLYTMAVVFRLPRGRQVL